MRVSRTLVESSSLASVGYEPESQVLEVEFRHGGVYQYFDVPASTHSSLLGAKSIGRHFVAEVRNQFEFRRMWDSMKTS